MAYTVIVLTPCESIIPIRIEYGRDDSNKLFLNWSNKSHISSGPGKIMIPLVTEDYVLINKLVGLNNSIEEFIKDLVKLEFTILFVNPKLNDVGLYMDIIDRLNCVKIQKPTKRAIQVEARTNLRYPLKRGGFTFHIRKARLHLSDWVYDIADFLRKDRQTKKIYASAPKGRSNNVHS